MKKDDVRYYVDQINFFTAGEATKKGSHISVIFPDGRIRTVKTSYEADAAYRECGALFLL